MNRPANRASTRRRALVAAVAAASLITLAACGSDDDGDAAAPSTPAAAAPSTPAAAPAGTDTITNVAAATPALSTLVAAVQAADLGATLNGAGPFTVFAPTNDAFAALPAGVVDNLLLPCNKAALTTVLTYHVIPAKVPAADVTTGAVATVAGENVNLTAANGAVTVNNAKVVQADVAASNGVVHVIDAVLVPPSVDPAALKTSC